MIRSLSNVVAMSENEYDAGRADEIEQALLGALMLDSAAAWPHVKDKLVYNDFARQEHREIFAAIAGLMEEVGAADARLVIDRLGDRIEHAGGPGYIVELYKDATSAESTPAYVKRIRERVDRGVVVDAAELFTAKSRSLPPADALRFLQEQLDRARREIADDDKAPVWPEPLNLTALLASEPVKPRMLIDDWLPCGYATMIAGHGGAGKSSIALHLSAAIAQGRAWWGRSTASRRVIYLSCEDRTDVIHWRLARICEWERWGAPELAGKLIIRDLVGHAAILYRSSFDGLVPTRAYVELERIMTDDPTAMLVVDGVSDTYGGNENDRGQVKTFVNALVRLVNADGAVLLVHHVNKQNANAAAAEGYSGSTGWHNSVRARWYLRPEMESDEAGDMVRSEGKLVLELQKTNHGRADQEMQLHWDEQARMFVAEVEQSSFAQRWGGADRKEAAEQCVLNALTKIAEAGMRATDGKTSPAYLPKMMRELKLANDFSPKELSAALGQLQLSGRVVEGVIGKYGNRTQKTGLMVVP